MHFCKRTMGVLRSMGIQFYRRDISSVPNRSFKKIQTGDKVSEMRTVSEEDVMNFAKLTGDFNPIHINGEQKLVHGALLNGFLSGVLGTKLPGPGTIVIEQYISYPKPCYTGDAIEISVEVLSARKIIKCGYKVLVVNSGKVVLQGEGKFIASKSKIGS